MKGHMRYASVCDGIGAAHAAWQPLGWECAWTSEIEPFPAAVVDHHWKLKNLGDMTKLTEEMLNECGPISLLCGGTPCQSFSVAGLRKGLEDPRGNLALRFTQLVGVLRPEWVVWENVPGVLSSGEGRDFGTFLGALAELGYGFAYRVLDAQWFGVAQRRRRVFVVAHARDWRRAAAVLFERESLFGDSPTRGAKGERVTGPIAGCSNGGGANGPGRTADDADCLIWRGGDQANSEVCVGHAGTLNCDKGQQGGIVAFQGGSQQDQFLTGDAVCPALCHSSNGNKGHHQPKVVVPFTKSKRAQSISDDETWVPGEVSPTMSCFDQGDTRATTVVAFTQNCRDEVRQINGDGQIAGALAADSGSHQTNYVAYDVHGTQASRGASETDCHTALRSRPPGQSEASTTTVVAQGFTYSGYSNQPAWMTGGRTDCLPASGHSDGSHQGMGVVCGDGDTVGTIRSNTRNNSDPVTEAAMHVMHGMAVRRLTPKECERLQGFPDGYTDVTYRGKPAADGPRYRALGNSMAVPVMAWIGKRIAEVEATDGTNAQH
jgi:DNA (cytosine-5)-methyltransferase 1